MSDVEQLMALEEIKRLKARRDHAIDTKDWDAYEALHCPDATSQAEGVPAPWKSAHEMRTKISAGLHGVKTVHQCHTPNITFDSAHRAQGIWAMEDMLFWKQGADDHWYHGYGYYYETYERRDGRWLFKDRRLERLHVTTSPGADMAARTIPEGTKPL
jgi:hypothetical protein